MEDKQNSIKKPDQVFRTIIPCIKKYHPLDARDEKKIEEAYRLVMKYSVDSNTEGEGQGEVEACDVLHSISVAKLIASWQFNQFVVISALLHELSVRGIMVNENLKSVDETTRKILDEYCKLKVQIDSTDYESFELEKQRKHFDFSEEGAPESLYIAIADHVDELSHFVDNPNNDALVLAQKTRERVVPLVKRINAFRLVDILENLCFQIENNKSYQSVCSTIQSVEEQNSYYREKYINKLKQIFDKDSKTVSAALVTYQKYIKLLCANKRSENSIFKFITQDNSSSQVYDTLQYDLRKANDFRRTAYYDVTLVLEDSVLDDHISIDSIFLQYFEKELQSDGALIYGYHYTTNRNACYYLLSDPMKNLYRFFVQTETEYLSDLYGELISKEKVSLDLTAEKDGTMIKVFKKDGKPEMIKKGATVLDLAFRIHEELGLCCEGAKLNDNNRVYPIHHVLSNGDKVEITKSNECCFDLNWLRYVKTELALNYLIKYLKENYECKKTNHT